MYPEKRKKLYIIIFLVLLVIGFVFPGVFFFAGSDQNQVQIIEPRLCTADADCWLTCDGKPEAAFCFQNLCIKNACEELSSIGELSSAGGSMELDIILNDKPLDLSQQKYLRKSDFVRLEEDGKVHFYATGIALAHLLDTLGMAFTDQCLVLDTKESFCIDNIRTFNMTVNGEPNYYFGSYVLNEGDEIVLIYE